MDVKDVCFVRHAKSSWDHPDVRDYDRPLNARGLSDAPMMARRMRELDLRPDYIITSGANRALTTARAFQAEFELPDDRFEIRDELYEADTETVFEVLRSAPDHAEFVYVFGHNPTMTWVANKLSGVHIDNVPTCGIVHAQSIITTWKKFKPEYAGFVGFHYPKLYRP